MFGSTTDVIMQRTAPQVPTLPKNPIRQSIIGWGIGDGEGLRICSSVLGPRRFGGGLRQ